MIKNIVLTMLFAGIAAQATTLEFDLEGVYYVNNKEKQVNVLVLNKQLNGLGLDGLPVRVVVNERAQPYGRLLIKRIEAAEEALKEDFHFQIEYGYFYEYPAICYRGEAADVPKIIKAMTGTFLNNEQGLLAIRYGSQKLVYDDRLKTKEAMDENYEGSEALQEFLTFNTRSKNVLVMSDLGPQGDGTELYATTIKPCP